MGIIKTKFPLGYGNQFAVQATDRSIYWISNMYHENFQELIDRQIIAFPIDIMCCDVTKKAILTDSRIPNDWYIK